MPPIFGRYVAVASERTSVSVTTPAERFHAVPSIPRMVRCIVLVLWWGREVKMLFGITVSSRNMDGTYQSFDSTPHK
jgi:hypothetical protein